MQNDNEDASETADDQKEGESAGDEGLGQADVAQLLDKAKSGELESAEADIDETTVAFDPSMFPELKQDATGDRVVCVLVGSVIATDKDAVVVEFSKASVVHGKMPPPGEGGRFQHLEHVLEGRGNVKDPAALSAWIGRKKYSGKKMAEWSAKGRREG